MLFVNCCIRDLEVSRTYRLATAYLEKRSERSGSEVETELILKNLELPMLSEELLAERDRLVAGGEWDDPFFDLARQFAAAEEIVIAAPYWDLSFPALLRAYFEQICVAGVTFRYTEHGPETMCRAARLTYVTTAGGMIGEHDLGYEYVRSLATVFFGIADVRELRAEGLDIQGMDAEAIMAAALTAAEELAAQ